MLSVNSPSISESTQRAGQRRRSRAGCWNCRSKTVKKRCDQQRPSCGRCCRLNLNCDYLPRPTLAERRRMEKSGNLVHAAIGLGRNSSSSPELISIDTPSLEPIVTLSIQSSSACSLYLNALDHEAIRHFRLELPKSQHVKQTDYTLMSLMLQIAQTKPIVMHMVIAIGLQELNLCRPSPDVTVLSRSIDHYSSAIRYLAKSIPTSADTIHLDTLCTTFWMMLLYEQQFGDAQHTAYVQHLKGLSSVLQQQFGRALALRLSEENTQATIVTWRSEFQKPTKLSIYSARVLVWIAALDSAAASAGIGGQINEALLDSLFGSNTGYPSAAVDPLKAFVHFRQYSTSLYRQAWGDSYPENELRIDLDNRDACVLLAKCVHLRYVVAQLAKLFEKDPVAAAMKASEVEMAILEVPHTFANLLDLATGLTMNINNSDCLVEAVRAIVPIYYAVYLDFMRLTSFEKPLDELQRYAVKTIINLASQSCRHGNNKTMTKIAWPLFIAALETDDMLHQEWILGKFESISKYGKNFERAYMFLLRIIPRQQSTGMRVDIRAEMKKTYLFVLG